MRKHFLFLCLLAFILFVFTSCGVASNGNENNTNANLLGNDTEINSNKNEDESMIEGIPNPVTLRVAVGIGEEAFDEQYKEPAEEHFPNLTLELVPFAPNREIIEEELMSGNIPDIIYGDNLEHIYIYDEYELLLDHSKFVEKFNFDLEVFNHGFLQMIRSYSSGEELWALPIDMTRYALHYNKDVFDLFGVEYPEDGLTWEEVIDLSRRVSGLMDGTEYVGLQLPVPRILLSTLSALLIDPETDEPLFMKEPEFTALFELYNEVYGSKDITPDLVPTGPFIGERNLAMVPTFYLYSDWTGIKEATEQGMNWDIATFPLWEKDKQYTPMVGGRWLALTDFSEHKDEAFQVMQFWLDAENIENIIESQVSVPFNAEATREFIDNVGLDEQIENQNIDALFSFPTLDKQSERSKYESIVQAILVEHIEKFISPEEDSKDINTAIRELQEAAEAAIEEEKSRE